MHPQIRIPEERLIRALGPNATEADRLLLQAIVQAFNADDDDLDWLEDDDEDDGRCDCSSP